MPRHEVQQPEDPAIRYIPLTKGQAAIVDAFLYEWLMQWNWSVHWNHKTQSFYAYRRGSSLRGEEQNVSMHRQILGLKQDDSRQGDHKNRVTLDNRGTNLRPGSRLLNAVNHRIQSNNKSGFRGVIKSWWGANRWESSGRRGGKRVRFGWFDSPEEAAKARDMAALEEYGEFSVLNFPELIDEYRSELARRNEASR